MPEKYQLLKDGLCIHGRSEGAVCIPCAEEDYSIQKGATGLDDGKATGSTSDVGSTPTASTKSGLNALYYDFPENIRTTMDLIEWLDLDFAQGNILKSIIRENNPNVKKETTPLYEAEKQFYYAERRLRNMQK